MADFITFQCGHSDEIKPGLFGRGKAREQRIAQYSNRPCYACAVKAVPAYVASLTMCVVTGERYSGEKAELKITEKIAKLKVSYLATINTERVDCQLDNS